MPNCKPDGAALVEWLQTWSPVTANGKRAHLAAAELTRLAAENRTYAEAHAFNSERFAEMLSERDAAKAEVARLTDLAQQRKWQLEECESDLAKAEAEIARLRAVAQEDPEREAHDRLGEFFLKPDTGETP